MAIRKVSTSSINTGSKTSNFWDQNTLVWNNTVDFLVVAGGGSGGGNHGAGGGAGGLRSSVKATGGGGVLENKLTVNPGTTYTITVGSGGARYFGNINGRGNAGTNSVFHTITSTGGGGGQNWSSGSVTIDNGGGLSNSGSTSTGISNQLYAGGSVSSSGTYAGGGGGAGGAGRQGAVDAPGTGGYGGVGLAVDITGTSVYYAGGGGAGGHSPTTFSWGPFGIGGLGGGGDGGRFYGTEALSLSGSDGQPNTGGGGGGSGKNKLNDNSTIANGPGFSANYSGAGGSGVVIIRALKAAASTTGSPTYTTIGSYHIYQFNGDGSITF